MDEKAGGLGRAAPHGEHSLVCWRQYMYHWLGTSGNIMATLPWPSGKERGFMRTGSCRRFKVVMALLAP